MPDRVVRDELLTSERYWSLSSDSVRLLFVHLMLRADDLGIFRAANYTLRSTCFGVIAPNPEVTAKLLAELADGDLIRLYQVDGVDLGYIPRFRQRLRVMKARHPLPPESLRDNDFNALLSKMSDGSQASVGHVSAEVKRSEEKRSKSIVPLSRDDACRVIDYLNSKTGHAYQHVEANLKLVLARFKDGATVEDCHKVIDAKTLEWRGDPEKAKYLAPDTLFNATKFAKYQGQLATDSPQRERVIV